MMTKLTLVLLIAFFYGVPLIFLIQKIWKNVKITIEAIKKNKELKKQLKEYE